MNCEEFGQRMHQCLDQRLPIDSDDQLSLHASQCESCRAQLHAWSQIATIMPGRATDLTSSEERAARSRAGHPSTRSFGAAETIAAAAAAVLIAVTLFWLSSGTANGIADAEGDDANVVELNDHEVVLADATGDLDPAQWWRSVQDRDWVGQTMPAVESVREGVAPIGRGLIRAVTILTMGGHDQTS